MDLETEVKKWVSLDNQVRVLNQQQRNTREERNVAEKNIINYIETNTLQNATINISDGKLKYRITKYSPPLTMKHVQACLENSKGST